MIRHLHVCGVLTGFIFEEKGWRLFTKNIIKGRYDRIIRERKAIKFKLKTRKYECPKCRNLLLRMPSSEPVPTETVEVQCPRCGTKVKLPNYRREMLL